MIYLKGLKSEDLGAMVDFLYSGEANVHQEDFDSFVTLAKELRLNGLWGDLNDLNDDDISYSDEENETREKNQKSSSSPLKKGSPNVKLDKDLQLTDLAGQRGTMCSMIVALQILKWKTK